MEPKRAAARAARQYVAQALPRGAALGIGTGTTAAAFIEELPSLGDHVGAFVASSEATRQALVAHGLRVVDLNQVDELPIYVDGADQITPALVMLKGGGGALTREKILTAASQEMVCIADVGKWVDQLSRAVPVEVLPMARTYVSGVMRRLGGDPRPRADFITDNGNPILDVHGLDLSDPIAIEDALERITGVVACGLFARRRADRLFLADDRTVRALQRADIP
jgi:ribose 5-phosphate isomerase A